MAAVVQTTDLSKTYRSFLRKGITALDSLNLTVESNRVFGFLGPNGAGKTTTIKLLLDLIKPDQGSGEILGRPLGDASVKEKIGFLPDSPGFYQHLTAYNFLAYCAKLLHLEWQDYSPRIDSLLEQMGLLEARNRKLKSFSRGMLQRVGIAQSLLNDPELVILDEPITGLDPLGRAEVKDIIRGLREEGRTVFFSSHILADVEQMCDEVGILNDGRLIRSGKVEDLLEEQTTTLWVKDLANEDVEECEEHAASVTKKKDLWGFTVEDASQLETLKEKIEQKGGNVTSKEGKRDTLENYFLSAVEADNQQRKEEEV